jgi:hypothetical protein
MSEPKHLATVRNCDELVAVVRARVAELNITHANLDDVSGVQSGYASKLLSDPPIRRFGPMSLGAVLGGLGLKLLVVQDEEALAKVRSRLVERIDGRRRIVTPIERRARRVA